MATPGGLFKYVCGAEKSSTPGGSTIVVAVAVDPSPQLMVTVLAWVPPGLSIVPLTLIVPFSSIEDCERTRPGAANSGAGLLMLTTVCAKAVSPRVSLKVTPIA